MKKINIDELKKEFPKAYDFITSHDMKTISEQRYNLGNNEYVNVESYNTFDFEERRYEAHKKYIDIQCIIVGKENIIVEPVSNLSISEKYDEDRDIAFFVNSVRGVDNILIENDMLVLEPEDGHMPCISVEESEHVKKAVFKFLV